MKIHNICAVIFALGLFASCDQYPIFYAIKEETIPRDPRIEGSPTNMVVIQRQYAGTEEPVSIMYVASGKLHWYTQEESGTTEPEWDLEKYPIPQPEGQTFSLAVTQKRLYALCLDGHGVNSTLWYIEHNDTSEDAEWTPIANAAADYPIIQAIYADPDSDYLFASASRNNRAVYSILYLHDDSDTLQLFQPEFALLSGAAYHSGDSNYYLSTRGGGMLQISQADLIAGNLDVEPLPIKTGVDDNGNNVFDRDGNGAYRNHRIMFMGMIKLEDSTIIAVGRNGGILYKVQDGFFEQMRYSIGNQNVIETGKYATGALALWEDDSGAKMLIAGIQGTLYYYSSTSSYSHGYVEFDLNTDGTFNTASTRRDSNSKLQSVSNTDQYIASLGTYPINHMFQVKFDYLNDDEEPVTDRTFFASTQTAGLWSYRDRNDGKGPQWNAEE